MLEFKKKNTIRIVSYDLFTFAFFIALKTSNIVNFNGLDDIVPNYKLEVIIEYAPIIITILAFGISGMFFPIQPLTFANFFKIWTRVLSIGFSTYESTIFLRNYFVPDCSDYVEELSAIEKNTLTCENSTEIATLAPLNEQPDSLECTNKKSFIHYTREKPTQHEIFVSTSPELEFCYEEDIQTLGGTVKDGQKVNEWIPDRKTEPIKRDSIPLKDRTKTLNDIRRLDSTADRETVLKIIRSYKQDQTTEKYVQEVIDGLIDW